jgi:hypothetical protein
MFIALIPKTEYKFHTTALLLLFLLWKYQNEDFFFFFDLWSEKNTGPFIKWR